MLSQSYGAAADEYIDGYLYEKHENDTHTFHRRDLEFLIRALQPVVQDMYSEIDREYGIMLGIASGGSQTDVYASKPDHRIVIKFKKLTQAMIKVESDIVMESVTMKDEPLRKLGEDMFFEPDDLHVDWPRAEKLSEPSNKQNKSRRLAVQMAMQMYDKSVKYSVFYTTNRTVYVKKEDNQLVRSHVESLNEAANEIRIDFVEYASWIMTALKEALDGHDLWYQNVYLPSYWEAESKMLNPRPVETRFALLSSLSLAPSTSETPFALLPRIEVQLGKKYVQEFDCTPTFAG
ncbi:hypothetical protein VKT23_003741 [Stygiomarasmius scandens]|uniref:Uncharacterized protein n=1 Tax=Marasmiellus scandens TaxID=2682957 RepID=A0ABR1JYJ9_9AGAR